MHFIFWGFEVDSLISGWEDRSTRQMKISAVVTPPPYHRSGEYIS